MSTAWIRAHGLAVVLAVLFLLFAPCTEADTLDAGQEGELVVPGCKFPCKLYVPSNYRRGTRLPLIFFLHGSGGKPTSWPWRTATDGKGYFIAGMSYGAFPDGGARGIPSDPGSKSAMIGFLEKVRAQLDEQYGIDQRSVFLTGLSMGGWGTNHYGFHQAAKGRYRGYAILAAGPTQGVDFTVAEGLPVLLLNGSKDANLAAANRGKPLLEKAGALVEQVVLEGEGHVPSVTSMKKPLSTWLEKVRKADAHQRAIAAVRWTPLTLTGTAPRKADGLAAHLAAQPAVQTAPADKPLLFFFASVAQKKGKPTKAAAASAKAEQAVFSYPDAFGPPSASRHFTCFRVDVSAADRKASPLLHEGAAPLVVLLGADRTAAVRMQGSFRRLADAMRAHLSPEQCATVDARLARIKPVLAALKKLRPRRAKLVKNLTKLRRKGSLKKLVQQEAALVSLDAEIEELRASLGEPAGGADDSK